MNLPQHLPLPCIAPPPAQVPLVLFGLDAFPNQQLLLSCHLLFGVFSPHFPWTHMIPSNQISAGRKSIMDFSKIKLENVSGLFASTLKLIPKTSFK